jgi:hypothetical protein
VAKDDRSTPLVDPAHGIASQPPSSRGFARSLRDNAIGIFPPQAFDEEVVFRKVFGRRQVIMNRPAGIQHILVDNPGNIAAPPPASASCARCWVEGCC